MGPAVVVVAGTHSGVGKTSLACGLMAALRQKGLVVQAFKVGPDFLDPMHHEIVTARPSINLDGWMLNKQQVLDTFTRHTQDADVAVIEGVMGLYDSRDGKTEDGSTAQIAKWLCAPVLLVIDCWCMARSVAAVVQGYSEFDPEVKVAGLLLNKVGSAAHGVWLREAIEAAAAAGQARRAAAAAADGQATAAPVVLGCIPKDDDVAVAERYLGLTMPHEQQQKQQQQQDIEFQQQESSPKQQQQQQQQQQGQEQQDATSLPPYLFKLGQLITQHVNLDVLLQIAATAKVSSSSSSSSSSTKTASSALCNLPVRCRIAVAKDHAFCFYYHDNISLLRAAGASIVLFSPLQDVSLPESISGLYLGGGYPERYLEQLNNNQSMLQSVRRFAASGGVIYAECGGLLYLSQGCFKPSNTPAKAGSSSSSSSNSENSSSRQLVPLVGVLPFTTQMSGMKMGYVDVEVLQGNPLFPEGHQARGQIYHFSEILSCKNTAAAAAAAAEDDEVNANSSRTSSTVPSKYVRGSSSSSSSSGRVTQSNDGDSTVEYTYPSHGSSSGSSSSSSADALKLTYRTTQVMPGAIAQLEGYCIGNVLASYVHLHWGGCPDFAAAFVDKCATFSSSSSDGSSSCTGFEIQAAVDNNMSDDSPAEDSQEKQHLASSLPVNAATSCGFCSSSSSSSSSSDKIISLLPSGTEILYALGLSDRLVAVSGFCDWPPEAAAKPRAVRSLVDVDQSTSDEIEHKMQSFKASGISPFEIDVELIRQHKPGLILTQDACQTCDADKSLVCKALADAGLNPKHTQVITLHPKTLAEILESIVLVGTAAATAGTCSGGSSSNSVVSKAAQLVEQLQARLQAVAAAVTAVCPAASGLTGKCTVNNNAAAAADAAAAITSSSGNTSSTHPVTLCHTTEQQQHQSINDGLVAAPEPWCRVRPARVLSLEGLNPLVLGGQWLPDMKLAAGCEDAAGRTPGDTPVRITWEQVLQYKPDVLLLCPCSRSAVAALPDVKRLTQLPGFSSIPAVQSGRVYVIDHGVFSRPGPGVILGVELLAWLVYGVQSKSLEVSFADGGMKDPVATALAQGNASTAADVGGVTQGSGAAAVTAGDEGCELQRNKATGPDGACSRALRLYVDVDGQYVWVPIDY